MILSLVSLLWVSPCVAAENVILMIGDGMGMNHITCTQKNNRLQIPSLPIKSRVKTASADSKVTDSAAAATAYACGIKTNNGYLGLGTDGQPCVTLAEVAATKGYHVTLITDDTATGATVAGFYAHTKNRFDDAGIAAAQPDNITVTGSVPSVTEATKAALKDPKQPFFMLIEGAMIDKHSHNQDFKKMSDALVDFDGAVREAVKFARRNRQTTVIVVADHETGGLTKSCAFKSGSHTEVDVPLYAFGKRANMFKGKFQNTEIHDIMHKIMLPDMSLIKRIDTLQKLL